MGLPQQSKSRNLIFTLSCTFILLIILLSKAVAHENIVVVPLAGSTNYVISAVPNPVVPDNRSSGFASFNGLVVDLSTNLAWQKSDDGVERTWVEAMDYCGQLTLGNQTAWRLPTVDELYTIMDLGASSLLLNTSVFNSSATAADPFASYWSANADSSLSLTDKTIQIDVSFGMGTISGIDESQNRKNLVRCVI